MSQRRIKRRKGEGVLISGPATVQVTRGVVLVIEAPRDASVRRISKQELRRQKRADAPRGGAPCEGD